MSGVILTGQDPIAAKSLSLFQTAHIDIRLLEWVSLACT